MKTLTAYIRGLKGDYRSLLFYATLLITALYLVVLYYKFFANQGTVVPSQLIGVHAFLLSGYVAATQAVRLQASKTNQAGCPDYQTKPGEWLPLLWIVSFALFVFINSVIRRGDGSVLSDIVGWEPDKPLDVVVGLWGISGGAKTFPQLGQKLGQKLAGVPITTTGGDAAGTPGQTPTASS